MAKMTWRRSMPKKTTALDMQILNQFSTETARMIAKVRKLKNPLAKKLAMQEIAERNRTLAQYKKDIKRG